MSVITRMIEQVFGRPEHRVLMVGLDASGRTTALYKLKLGEVVTTIPTIGFNVETVQYKGTSLTFWDVGGCDKIRPLWRHYYQNTSAVFFFVDSHDRERVGEAAEELQRMLAEEELRECVLVVLANKQDLPNAMSVAEVTEKLGLTALRSHRWAIQATCAVSGDGLYECLDAFFRLRQGAPPSSAQPQPKPQPQQPPASKEPKSGKKSIAEQSEEVLLEWLERKDDDDDVFLQKLADYSLDSWDHYTHLRIAWLLLGRHGRREGMQKIFQGIRLFIENSKRTQRARGTTFHETMTYFWVHMVHYAQVTTTNPNNDFKTFLLLNPQLANGGMFLHYYSKKLMLNTAQSRTEVVLPDKNPLPSLVTDVSRLGISAPKPVELAPDSDEAFLANVEAGTLKGWGHESRLRLIWLVLRNEGRQKGVKIAMERVKQLDQSGFNYTHTYFWLQFVHLTTVKLEKAKAAASTFAEFTATKEGKALVQNIELPREYYSDALMFSDEAVAGFVPPDKKPVPNIVV